MHGLRWGLAALLVMGAVGRVAAQPANDDCANATVIGSLPFTDEVDNTLATTEGGEPASSCGGSTRSVWYQFTAGGSDVNLYVDSFAGDDDFAKSVFPGTCGAFGPEIQRCGYDDDNASVLVPAGTTVLIRIGSGPGTLQLTIDEMPEFLVTANGAQYRPQGIGASPDGRFVVAWPEHSGSDLLAKVFDGAGTPLSGDVTVDSIGGVPDVDGLAPSGFVVTWGDFDDIFVRLLDADGIPQGAAFQVNDGTGGEEARVAADGSGNFVVAWFDESSNTGPIFRLFDSGGVPKGPQVDLGESVTFPVDVGMDSTGNFVVAWWRSEEVFAQRFDSNGGSLGTPFVVNVPGYPPNYAFDELALAVSSSGEFLVAWSATDDFNTGSSNDVVRARVFAADGAAKGESFVLSDAPTTYYPKHRLRADDDGNGDFIVVWEDDGGRNGYGGGLEMMGRRVSRSGAAGGSQFELATANFNHQYDPNVAGGPNGEFMVVWNSYRADEPWGSDYAVPARIFGPDDARFDVSCAAAPLAGCITPVAAAASKILLRDDADDVKDQLKWKLTKGDATTAADFGNPAQASTLAVCLYDAGSTLVFEGIVHPGGDCGKPCWKASGKPAGAKGYKFKNTLGEPNGIQKMVLKPGEAGKTKIVIKGGRENLSTGGAGFSPLPLALPAKMQLQRENGTCWEAVFDAGGVQAETANLFRAKSAAP